MPGTETAPTAVEPPPAPTTAVDLALTLRDLLQQTSDATVQVSRGGIESGSCRRPGTSACHTD